ncbi:MAG: DUF4258 domain-containing protein [Ottowia sp.]|uniref:DUF4258 domain-containing protein n=1 Tax=Ottowia sp. TaxID=1898956 RepID=UPI0039E4AEF5
MVTGSVFTLSKSQLAKLIRSAAGDSAKVIITAHARKQMKDRKMPLHVAIECLRRGVIRRTPEPNTYKGTLECRMEHFCSGHNCCVVAAISDDTPNVIMVTVFYIE